MTQIIRKTWIPILIGLLFPAGSVLAQVHTDSIVGIDSIHVAQNLPVDSLNDTVAVAKSDSVPPRRNNALDDPVIYESKDSMVWNYGGYAYLYGNGKVTYQDVVLTSAIIKMQMDSSLVYADGVRDSSGKWEGTPVFMDGSTPYESNHISYNFKTRRWPKALGITSFRLYAQAQNLFCITGYSGFDPEINSYYNDANLRSGIDSNTTPLTRTISFGANISF